MRTISIETPHGVGVHSVLTDVDTGKQLIGVSQIQFDNLNPLEIWTGTLVYLHGGQEDERVYLVTAA